jgi:hypothetical protein
MHPCHGPPAVPSWLGSSCFQNSKSVICEKYLSYFCSGF